MSNLDNLKKLISSSNITSSREELEGELEELDNVKVDVTLDSKKLEEKLEELFVFMKHYIKLSNDRENYLSKELLKLKDELNRGIVVVRDDTGKIIGAKRK